MRKINKQPKLSIIKTGLSLVQQIGIIALQLAVEVVKSLYALIQAHPEPLYDYSDDPRYDFTGTGASEHARIRDKTLKSRRGHPR